MAEETPNVGRTVVNLAMVLNRALHAGGILDQNLAYHKAYL